MGQISLWLVILESFNPTKILKYNTPTYYYKSNSYKGGKYIPTFNILCPPAAATSNALFTDS